MRRVVACFLALSVLVAVPAQAGIPVRRDRAKELLAANANSLAELHLWPDTARKQGVSLDEVYYQLGLARLKLKDWPRAQDAFEHVPVYSPWYPKALAKLAELYSLQGKSQRAIRAYRALIPLLGTNSAERAQFDLAEELFAARAYEEAIAVYRTLEYSRDASLREAAWYGAGWAASRAGLRPRAIWFFRQVLLEFPTSPRVREARLQLANHYLRLGKLNEAAAQLTALRASNAGLAMPDEPSSLPGNHLANDENELFSAAEFLAAEAGANANDWVRAVQHYQAVPLSSHFAEAAAYGSAWSLQRLGRLPEARQALLTYLQRYPKGALRAAALYAMGRVQQDSGLLPEARESYREVLQQATGKWAPEALYQLAALELAAGQIPEALRWAKRLEREYPGGRLSAPGLWLLAEAQLASGALSDAIVSYRRLARHPESLDFLEGKSEHVLFKLGIAYFRDGNFPAADTAFRQLTTGPLASEAAFWHAESLYRSGNYRPALEAYQYFLKHHGSSERAPEATYGLAWALL
ncbi:MAG: tetratricopeptide repeat protein, partial [Cyanobacteria bacterium NC_groundwater_1444_Ag_S-0.65um_54_12]|nr:tetratricopeptide repeat protein [Cyanobacteria bacterium NC_groundwater_1444_Ag_S-0.65um_54_12]